MHTDVTSYNFSQTASDREICEILMQIIDQQLHYTEKKIWHSHPVWFIDGNPIVGYSKQKNGIKVLFWSGADFDEVELELGSGKFKDASIKYTSKDYIDEIDLKRWLTKAESIQWDYKNIVKHKGQLQRIS